MTPVVLRPRKRIRHELMSLVPLTALTAALVLAFPFKLFTSERRAPHATRHDVPSCVYIELTAEEESRAMDAIRSAFATDAGGIRDLRADLSLSTIPERPTPVVLGFDDRKRPGELRAPALEILVLPKTYAAPEPGVIQAAEPPAARPAFSKEELLKPID